MLWCFRFLFFKQNAAYEVRISDWISDVCSSDLVIVTRPAITARRPRQAVIGPVPHRPRWRHPIARQHLSAHRPAIRRPAAGGARAAIPAVVDRAAPALAGAGPMPRSAPQIGTATGRERRWQYV